MRSLVLLMALGLVACSSSSSSGGDGTDGGGSSTGQDGGTGSGKDSGTKGTGDSGGGGTTGAAACLQDDGAVCATYDPPSSSGCASGSSVVASCPTTGLQAKCVFTAASTDEVFYWYTSAGESNAALKSVCDSESGTFTTY